MLPHKHNQAQDPPSLVAVHSPLLRRANIPPLVDSGDEKRALVSEDASPAEVGGPREGVQNVFFCELEKRETGRLACAAAACTHFLAMDCDEVGFNDLPCARRATAADVWGWGEG